LNKFIKNHRFGWHQLLVIYQCSYSTKTGQKLNEHIRVQHQLKGIKPYLCPYCDFTCATSGNCRKHIKGKHKGKEVRYDCDKEYLEVAKMARKEGNTNPISCELGGHDLT
jgi:hypothetical protein